MGQQLAECEAVPFKCQPGTAETLFVFAELKGALTCNKKCNAYSNDTQVPQAPEVCGIQECPGVFPLSRFIIGKGCDPDVE